MPHHPTIEETLLSKLRPGLTPNELIHAVRVVHPEASKKEIIHAAFATVITLSKEDPERARALQDFALRNRGS